MKRTRIIPAALLALATLVLPGLVSAQVSRFDVRETVFSPDGDGLLDSTRVQYTIASVATSLSLVVFEADGTTPVDTVRAPAQESETTLQTYYWDGRRFDDTPAPAGEYVVTLRMTPAIGSPVVRSLPVFIDVTPPQIQILSAIPDPYAPGVAGKPASVQIAFVVSSTSPVATGRTPDELQVVFRNPLDALVDPDVTITPAFTGADGSYTLAWDASEDAPTLADGEYSVTLTVVDAAGYSVPDTRHFDIDSEVPALAVTSLAANASLQTLPDTLYGYTTDERGVDSLQVRYRAADPFVDVASIVLRDDTTFFAIPLASLYPTDGVHTVDLRSGDSAGRLANLAFTVTLDRAALSPPVLEAFNGVSRINTYVLRGTADNDGDVGAWVRIRRNGVQVDSVSTLLGASFTRTMTLTPGRNEFTAVLRDAAFNASAPSNTVVVNFNTAAGLYVPVPFPAGGSFAVNTARNADRVSLRVFDLIGNVVIEFERDDDATSYAFAWDGRNGSGITVRRGPLVVIAEVIYPDGEREILREAFLFNPDAP